MANLFEMPRSETPDASARLQALDIERSWIVEAPAGSGKTGLLIQRYLRLLADPKVTLPEQVLAITFTKAASQEIRERLLRELHGAQEGSEVRTKYDRATRVMADAVLMRDQMLNWRLLDEPRRLRVRTIDSVCAEIARSLPILSGGNGSLMPVEDASSLYREAANRTWLHLGGEDLALSDALRHLLLHRDGDLGACVSLVAEMLAQREQWGALIPLRDEDLTKEALDVHIRQQLDEALKQVVCEGLSRLARAFPEQTLQRLTALAMSLSDRPGYNNQPSPIAVCRELQTSPAAAADHLVYWRALIHLLVTPSTKEWRSGFSKNQVRFEMSKKDRSALKEVTLEVQERPELLDLMNEVSNLPPVSFPTEQWPVTKALFHVLRQALADLQLVFSERTQCDFAEPALLARYVLSQDGALEDLESVLGAELQHLLVDEMQDTSVRQYDLLERLTEGWADEHKTVFLVGDPKQSIYLFRQARVERFIDTMQTGKLGNLSVGPLQLTANFRSQAGLISAFNADFSKIFPASSLHPEDVTYVQGTAIRAATPELTGEEGYFWHLKTLPRDSVALRTETHLQLRRNGRRIRQIVEEWRSHPLPPGRTTPWKIAVLVQSRASLESVLPELKQEPSIPFRALKIESLDERPEVLDLLALTRALLHPADRTAWLAVLHAPWCGIGLADLHVLTGKDDDQFLGWSLMDLIAAHGADVSIDGVRRLQRVWPVLDAANRSSERVRLPERVERTWRSLGGNTFLSDLALRNAEAFLDLLRVLDREEGQVEHAEVTRRLRNLYASPQEGDVELVTIHGSKGLEWDVVLVPELERRSPSNKSRLFEIEELVNGRVVLAPITAKGAEATALNCWLRSVRSRREAAERKRLFYVACTRAREELHLFGVAFTRRDGTRTATASSLLEAAWPAAEAHLIDPEITNAGDSHQLVLFDLAASEEPKPVIDYDSPLLERLPLDTPLFFPPLSQGPTNEPENVTQMITPPPESYGSFSSRCLGVTVHTFLEETAARLANGSSPNALASELPAWNSRIRALLRASGLPPRSIEQHVLTVERAIATTLRTPVGQWLLGARSCAKSEFALVTHEDRLQQHRIDRMFLAGASPCEVGETYRWIIDYKTSAYIGALQDETAIQEFLDGERLRYASQMERYLRLVDEEEVRLGLWFPLLGKLIWWRANNSEEKPGSAPGIRAAQNYPESLAN